MAGLEQIDRAGRHHLAPTEKVLGAPVEILKYKAESVVVADFLEDPLGLRNDLRANSVTGDYRYRKGFHGVRTQL
jgi:hypothetical protein